MLYRRAGVLAGSLLGGAAAGSLVSSASCKDGGAGLSVVDAIGNTPLIELKSLSKATGCRIFAKCEHMNPGGSIKDRAAKWLIEEAERKGELKPGDTICEGTGGNTGIGLAIVANAKGYKTIFAMPKSIAKEKIDTMKTYGATTILTPGVPFSDERHYFHVAAKLAAENEGYFFTNQFENLSNSQAHFESTAPEMYQQLEGKLDGFVCAAGTGGTIGGISAYLKEQSPAIQCYVIDPPGSGLKDLVESGVYKEGPSPSSNNTNYAGDKSVKYIERSPGSSMTEGIGIDRMTANFERSISLLDGALTGTDREAVEMAYYLMRNEGLCIGPSAALNVVGAVKLGRKLGPGKAVATVICDGGDRYRSKLFSQQWLEEKGLVPTAQGSGLDFIGE
jgi:cysteine synthase A